MSIASITNGRSSSKKLKTQVVSENQTKSSSSYKKAPLAQSESESDNDESVDDPMLYSKNNFIDKHSLKIQFLKKEEKRNLKRNRFSLIKKKKKNCATYNFYYSQTNF